MSDQFGTFCRLLETDTSLGEKMLQSFLNNALSIVAQYNCGIRNETLTKHFQYRFVTHLKFPQAFPATARSSSASSSALPICHRPPLDCRLTPCRHHDVCLLQNC